MRKTVVNTTKSYVGCQRKNSLISILMLFASFLVSNCGGTAPSKTERRCEPTFIGGEVSLSDGSFSCSRALTSREVPACGDRITVDEVQTVDLEDSDHKLETLLAQIGPFDLLTESPIAINSRGSTVQTIKSAKALAAARGCNLMLVGPFQTTRAKYKNPTNQQGGSQVLKRYMLVQFGVLKK